MGSLINEKSWQNSIWQHLRKFATCCRNERGRASRNSRQRSCLSTHLNIICKPMFGSCTSLTKFPDFQVNSDDPIIGLVCTSARVHMCTCAHLHICTFAHLHICTCARVSSIHSLIDRKMFAGVNLCDCLIGYSESVFGVGTLRADFGSPDSGGRWRTLRS